MAFSQNSAEFLKLAKTMKNYVISTIVNMIVSFIGIIIIQFGPIIPMMFMDPYNMDFTFLMTGTMIILFVISGIVGFILFLYRLIMYFQFLTQLKKVSDCSNDYNLQRFYKFEMASLIISILFPIILILGIIILYFSIFVNVFNGYYSYEGFLIGILLFILFILFFAVISITVQVLAVISFDKFGQNLKVNYYQNPYAGNIAGGTNNMKIGKIVTIVAGTIGTIIYLFGFWEVAKNLKLFFDNYDDSPQFMISGPSFSTTTAYPRFDPQIRTPTVNIKKAFFCPYCGTKLLNKNTTFCSQCGRKII